MEKSTILAALTFLTLCSGLAVAAHQLWLTEKAKKEGTGGPMLRNPSGAKPGTNEPEDRTASASPAMPSPVATAQGRDPRDPDATA